MVAPHARGRRRAVVVLNNFERIIEADDERQRASSAVDVAALTGSRP